MSAKAHLSLPWIRLYMSDGDANGGWQAGMTRWLKPLLLLLPLCLLGGAPAWSADHVYRIATKESPPFSMKDKSGTWRGISISLLMATAANLNIRYELIETDLQDMLTGVAEGRYDAAVAALTVTPERMEVLDFSHPYYTTGLGIAVADHSSSLDVLLQLSWREILMVLGTLLGLMLLAGTLVWLVERKANPGQFGPKPVPGIGAGMWWAAVTLTTVGYGDKAPLSSAGRAIAVVWMLASLLITASFTAAITSALTVNTLHSAISGPEDLIHHRVGSIAATSSAQYLDEHHITFRAYPNLDAGLQAVVRKEIAAFVYDKPLLQYAVGQMSETNLKVLPRSFARQDYAIALPNSTKYREKINQAMLRYIDSPDWPDLLRRWLGPD